MWLIQSLCLLIRNTFALFSSYVSCCEEERARSIALFLPSLPLFFLPIFLTFFQPYSFVTRVTHTFIHSRSRNPSSSSSGNALPCFLLSAKIESNRNYLDPLLELLLLLLGCIIPRFVVSSMIVLRVIIFVTWW